MVASSPLLRGADGGGAKQPISDLSVRCGSLLLSASADAPTHLMTSSHSEGQGNTTK